MINFKTNKTAIEFLKKNKVRLQSLTAAVLVATTLVGCGKYNAKNNIDNALVITTESGEKTIVKKIERYNCDDKENRNHFHYIDIVTGNYYSDSQNCINRNFNDRMFSHDYPIYVSITNIESISDYLTSEEISKLLKGEFTNDDFAKLAVRIKESEVEEVKTK